MVEKIALTIPAGPGKSVSFNTIGGPANSDILITRTIPALIQIVFVGAVILALFLLILGGFKWITSGGDKGGVESARKTITFAIVGLVIIFLSFFIVSVIGTFFGVKLIK